MKRLSQARGSALIYILIAIALIAALTVVFMQPASQQTRSQNSFKLSAELNGQVQMIRASIQDCILLFPQGDTAINASTLPGYHGNYPLEPDSTYLPTAGGFRAADKNLANIRCPGNNPGTPSNQHALIFGGSSGRFMPPTPALFSPWMYYNGTNETLDGQTVTGVFFQISSNASDAYVGEAMQKIDESLTECEADYIVGTGSNGCTANSKCLRIWVKRVAPSCP